MILEHHLITVCCLIQAVSAANHQAGTGFSMTHDSELDKLEEMDVPSPVDQRSVTAEPGETVTLPCRVPLPVRVLQWHRSNRTEYVLSYRDEQFDPEDQDPSFVNRVDLKDGKMTDGDASLIIENITISDAGAYECRAIGSTANRRRREIPVIGIVHLDITRSGNKPEDEQMESKDGLKVGVAVGVGMVIFAAAAAVVAGIWIYKRHTSPSRRPQGII